MKYKRDEAPLRLHKQGGISMSNIYARFTDDLKTAVKAARFVDLDNDGGTCNFDSLQLYLPRYQEKRVMESTMAAGLRCFKYILWGHLSYVFSVPVPRQGNARTRQAEAMCETMRDKGYDASVYYQMD